MSTAFAAFIVSLSIIYNFLPLNKFSAFLLSEIWVAVYCYLKQKGCGCYTITDALAGEIIRFYKEAYPKECLPLTFSHKHWYRSMVSKVSPHPKHLQVFLDSENAQLGVLSLWLGCGHLILPYLSCGNAVINNSSSQACGYQFGGNKSSQASNGNNVTPYEMIVGNSRPSHLPNSYA